MRYFTIDTIRVREGQGQEFTDLAKLVVAGAEKSGGTQPVATYQVVSGAPDGTFLLLEPMESLKSMDEDAQRERALVQAVSGGPATLRQLDETLANDEIDFVRRESDDELRSQGMGGGRVRTFGDKKPAPAVTTAPSTKAAKRAAK